MTCWLAQFSEQPCQGRLIKAHLIPKQRIKREFRSEALLRDIVWDPRVWVPACGGLTGAGGHHGAFDMRQLVVPRSAVPSVLEQFAEQFGLVWSLDRDYGLAEVA